MKTKKKKNSAMFNRNISTLKLKNSNKLKL